MYKYVSNYMYDNVLVPLDYGVKSNKNCLDEACHITKPSGTIHCLTVDLSSVPEKVQSTDDPDDPLERTSEYIENLNYNTHRAERDGVPSEEIARYADKNNIDVIIMHTYNPKGIKKLISGSVTEETIDYTNCPVLVLSDDAK